MKLVIQSYSQMFVWFTSDWVWS